MHYPDSLKFHPASVEDNDDPEQEGKVQIKVDYLMEGFTATDLPWARPFPLGSGGNSSYGIVDIPEIGSKLWVWFENEELLRHPYFVADLQLSGLNPVGSETSAVSATGSASAYPDLKFRTFINGIMLAIDSSTANPEVIVYHPKGTFFIIDKDGKLIINAPEKVLVKGDLEVEGEVTANSASPATKVTLTKHEHIGNLGSPTSPPKVPE